MNLTNTIFIDKPLIVSQVVENSIPDETDAMLYCAPLNPNVTLICGGPTWPSTVINRLVGQPPNACIETIDPELTDRNLPPYPTLIVTSDISKVEEIRRTVYLSNIDKEVSRIVFTQKRERNILIVFFRLVWIFYMNFYHKLVKFDIFALLIQMRTLRHVMRMLNLVNNRQYPKFFR